MEHHEKRFIEVCCGSKADVEEARCGGASRIELCSALELGGLTPSIGLINEAVKTLGQMQLGVIIRPRGGDFVYSKSELETMEADIRMAVSLGADVIVTGALTAAGDIDREACLKLLSVAPEKSYTFHRAFDVCRNPGEALEEIISLGFDRLLTSGCCPTAEEGIPQIADLIRQADGRIKIMPGSGITPRNIQKIEQMTKATEFHSTARGESRIHHVFGREALGFGENKPTRHTDRSVVSQLVEA